MVALQPSEWVALVSSAAACVYTFQRRSMLSPSLRTWHDASGLVQFVLVLQTAWFGIVFFSIAGGSHCNWREAVAYALSALVSSVMVHNLDKSGRRSSAEDAHGVRGEIAAGDQDRPS